MGRLLADHIQEPVGGGILRRGGGHVAADAPPSWHLRFTKLALELIGVTTTGEGLEGEENICGVEVTLGA